MGKPDILKWLGDLLKLKTNNKTSVVDAINEQQDKINNCITIGASCNKDWKNEAGAGQPKWLWGCNEDLDKCRVFDPSEFNVKSANYARMADKANITSLTEPALRNITISPNEPDRSVGVEGDIWIQYE